MTDKKASAESVAQYLWGIATNLSANAPQENDKSVKLGSAILDAVGGIKELTWHQDAFQDDSFVLDFFNNNKQPITDLLDDSVKEQSYNQESLVGLRRLIDTDESDEMLLKTYEHLAWTNISNNATELQKQLARFAVDNAVYQSVSAYKQMKELENHMGYLYDDFDYRV